MAYYKCSGGKGAQIFNLGTSTSINVQSYDGWQNFTHDNFLVVTTGGSSQGGNARNPGQPNDGNYNASIGATGWSYNASTGILTVSPARIGVTVPTATNYGGYVSVRVYLVIYDD